MPTSRIRRWLVAALCLFAGSAQAQTTVNRSADLDVDVSETDGRLAISLLGGLWILPPSGGEASQIIAPMSSAEEPRWSPDGQRILYTVHSQGTSRLRLLDLRTQSIADIGPFDANAQDAVWHPRGNRIAFVAERANSGLDLFEVDLKTGLHWRLTSQEGDESEPAWSASGRDLVYVSRRADTWALMLRRFGQTDVELLQSNTAIAAPAWRPDGTLISFFQDTETGAVQQMAILSEPILVRPILSGEDFARTPIRWIDRERFLYVANGHIRTREFDSWTPKSIAFRVTVQPPAERQSIIIENRVLAEREPAPGRLVIRAGRLFDGLSRSYRQGVDVLMEDGFIAELSPQRDWNDTPLVELPATTLLPGYIDVYSSLPSGRVAEAGAELLSWGITTVVSPEYTDPLAAAWSGTVTPGPRLLAVHSVDDSPDMEADRAFLLTAFAPDDAAATRILVDQWRERGRPVIADGWVASAELDTNALIRADTLPTASFDPAHIAVTGAVSPILISGLASQGTPGLSALFRSRQAHPHRIVDRESRRRPSVVRLRGHDASLAAGSLPNGLPAGLALHAELRALSAAGVTAEQILATAGVNAARLLGLSGQIGEISKGARADMVLVAGDPLHVIADTANIVGVVRNGQFFSLINLLERRSKNVE